MHRRSGILLRGRVRIGATFVVLVFLMPARAEQATAKGRKPLPSDQYIAMRSGLPNSRIRFEKDKRGRVAYLGGSITHMKGWRDLVCENLRKRFPQTEFDFIDAGIPSTDSTLGPFRIDSTVFHRGRVDLLFVEFAVNDSANGRSAVDSVRGMEGVIRKARAHNPCIDLVMMYFVDPDKMAAYRAGKTPTVIVAHEKVARHYGIPAVDLAKEVTERIDAGEFTWKKFGGLHPGPFGHALYARTIERLFQLAWDAASDASRTLKAHRTPEEPLDPLNYERGRFVHIRQAKTERGWRIDPSWKPQAGSTRPGFVSVPMLVADEPGAALRLKFNGTAVGVLVPAGPDVGVLEYAIDGGPLRKLDLFTQWSHYLHIPWAYIFEAELPRGGHELMLRIAEATNPKSKGHACRIVQFLAN